MAADPGCRDKHAEPVTSRVLVLGEGNALGNVFVQVKNPPRRDYPVPSEPVVVDQVGCLYQPRVAGVRVGQPVLFRNSDQLMHNVRGQPEANKAFNIGMPAVIPEDTRTFNQPEPIFPIKCDIHPWMQAYIAVMTHPYFAVTTETGTFSIAGLPPGTYEIEAWHERLGTQTRTVTVPERGSATADFAFRKP
jgi:plastocyanin